MKKELYNECLTQLLFRIKNKSDQIIIQADDIVTKVDLRKFVDQINHNINVKVSSKGGKEKIEDFSASALFRGVEERPFPGRVLNQIVISVLRTPLDIYKDELKNYEIEPKKILDSTSCVVFKRKSC